jgi:hypothetical protein
MISLLRRAPACDRCRGSVAPSGPARDDQGPGDQRRRVAGPAGLYRQPARRSTSSPLARAGAQGGLRTSFGPMSSTFFSSGPCPRHRAGPSADPAGAGRRAVRRSRAGRSTFSAPMPRATRCSVPNRLRQQRDVVPAGVLEQQRRAAGAQGAVGDLGDLEVRVDLGADAPEFTALLEPGDEFAEVAVAAGHGAVAREPATSSSWTGRTRRWSSCP